MRVIIGGQYYSTLDAATVSISKSVSDPVPTCQLTLTDQNSTIDIPKPSEIIVLDEQVIPNPTINLVLNPTLNPYTTTWQNSGVTTGIAFSQHSGGGATITLTNAAGGQVPNVYQFLTNGSVVPLQSYTFSFTLQGSGTMSNFTFDGFIDWLDAANNVLETTNLNGPIGLPPTTPTIYSTTAASPAGTVSLAIILGIRVLNSTNSGAATFTNAQIEPTWFPTQNYPTPFCGPSQTNCQQLPLGYWIRQYRKFGGFVNDVQPQNYRGNTRDYVINAVGYAWLLSTIYVPDLFTSKTDAQIITSLLSTYLVSTPPFGTSTAMCNTTNVISSGITLSSFQSNWDDLRTNLNNLASQSTFYWTIDDYWNAIYAPYGYFSMQIGLVLDDSSNPDDVSTFPGYAVSAEEDFTQPGSTILVIGSGTNVAKVIDPAQTAQIGLVSGYYLPAGTAWMRKVNESSLGSIADCTQRGQAELLQYDYERDILNVTTNEELFAGYGISVTDAQDGYSSSILLVQDVTATWIGTNETLTDEWEYAAVLGSVNRDATNILSRIYRATNSNSSAPAVSTTTLEALESIGISDTVAISSALAAGYQPTILGNGPIAYYRLNNLQGTTVDDFSGNGYVGTSHNSPTLQVPTLLTDAQDSSDTAQTFASASSQYISLPTSFTPTGSGHAWSLEAWALITSIPGSGNYAIITWGANSTNNLGQIRLTSTGTTAHFDFLVFNTDLNSSNISANTIYHLVGTYDGSNLRFYINGSLAVGPTAATVNLGTTATQIGAAAGPGSFFNGTIDETAFYNYALSAVQISIHYAAGTSVYALTVMQDAPTAYYRLGEASGTTANDASGNANTGTYNSSGVTLGQAGALFSDSNTAALFNGSTGYVTLPTATNGNGASALTIELWAKLSTTSLGSFTNIISAGLSATHTGYQIYWSGTTNLTMTAGNGTANGTAVYSTNAVAGTWWHIVGVYDGSSVLLYVNGTQVGTTSALSGTISASANPIVAATTGHSSKFPGTIDEVAVYPTALSSARIQAHYNAGTLGHQ